MWKFTVSHHIKSILGHNGNFQSIAARKRSLQGVVSTSGLKDWGNN